MPSIVRWKMAGADATPNVLSVVAEETTVMEMVTYVFDISSSGSCN